MKVLCVQTNTNAYLWPLPIGAAMVAQRLRDDGHEVAFCDCMGERDASAAAARHAHDFAPDLVCCSIRNRDNQSLLGYHDPLPSIRGIIDAVRRATPAPVVLGGTAFTTFPGRMLEAMDAEYGIAGDDLDAVARFVRSMAAGSADLSVPGLTYRDGAGRIVTNGFALTGYRASSGAHHALIDRRRYRRAFWDAAVITRSGCPERCAYCDTYRTFGREFILRDATEVADELLMLKRDLHVRTVWLVDAGFNRPLEHAKEVLRAIIRRGAQMHLYALHDPGPCDREYLRLFRRAGGLCLNVFAESLSDPVLEALDKSFHVEDVERDAAMMREEGIDFMVMPVLGGPGETPETIDETLARLPKLRAAMTDLSIGWRIMPGTPLQQRAVEEGVLDAGDDCWQATFYLSRATPLALVRKRLRRFRMGHPLMPLRIVPFIVHAATRRPWQWGEDRSVDALVHQ